jgi:hypothetical protein
MLVGCKFLIGSPKLDRLQGRGQKKDGLWAFGLGSRLTTSLHKTMCVKKSNDRYQMIICRNEQGKITWTTILKMVRMIYKN